MSNEYPASDFPLNFYFNGEVMPKWGACWCMARIAQFLQVQQDTDQDVGHRDVYIVYCDIDRDGVVESADPDLFIYAVQEVLYILLSQRDSVLAHLGNHPLLPSDQSPEVYSGLVAAAFRMRELTVQQRCAFWISGDEEDRVQLVDIMRRCQLPPDSPDFTLPKHIKRWQLALQIERDCQISQLNNLAQSGQLDEAIRNRLLKICAA